MAELRECWSNALYPFHPSSFLSLSTSSKKSSLQLPVLHRIWLCPIHLHLSSFVWNLLGCECRGARLTLTQQFLLIQLLTGVNPPSYCQQPSSEMLVCHQVLCPWYFLFSLPCSATWALSCPNCCPAHAEPRLISLAEFINLDSVCAWGFYFAPYHEEQVLLFLSGHGATWHLP